MSEAGAAGRTPRWYEGVPPVTVEVACGGRPHRLTWRRGKLVLEDHQLGAEQALVALGGASNTCLELLGVWAQGARDLHAVHRLREQPAVPSAVPSSRRVFVPGSQLPSLAPATLSRLPERQRQQLQATFARRERTRLLWSLPPELHVRLALSAVMRAERAGGPGRLKESAALDEVLRLLATGAVRESMRSSTGLAAGARIDLDVGSIGADEPPWLEGKVHGQVASAWAGLPWSWVARVWGWGLAVVDGAFVLAVTDADPLAQVVRVLATRWEAEPGGTAVTVTEPATAVRHEGRWHLAGD